MTNLPPFDRSGPATAPSVILIHGASLSRRMWVPAAAVLATEFQVLAVDLPGHGHRPDRFTLAQSVAETAALINAECPGGAILAGDSLGGYVTMAVATRWPALVKGAVVSGATCAFDRPAWRTRLAAVGNDLLVKAFKPDRLMAMTLKRVREAYPKAPIEEIVAGGIRLEARPAALRELARADLLGALPSYSGPMLLVNGELDRVGRRHEALFLAASRGKRVEVMAGLPLGVSLADPEGFARIVAGFARGV